MGFSDEPESNCGTKHLRGWNHSGLRWSQFVCLAPDARIATGKKFVATVAGGCAAHGTRAGGEIISGNFFAPAEARLQVMPKFHFVFVLLPAEKNFLTANDRRKIQQAA